EMKPFDRETEAGKTRRRKIEWWSWLFTRHTLADLESKKDKIKRQSKAYDEISFEFRDPNTGIGLCKTFFDRLYKKDRASCNYIIEKDPFQDTGLGYYAIKKAFFENAYYNKTPFFSVYMSVYMYEDEPIMDTLIRLEEEGYITFIKTHGYGKEYIVLRKGSVYHEETLPSGRIAIFFQDPEGRVYMQLGKGSDAKAIIYNNRVTYNATEEDLDLLVKMKTFNKGGIGERAFHGLELGITKDDYIRYLREEFEYLI
ncbi:unnamed protein product, partial [marine sediment metagenome]